MKKGYIVLLIALLLIATISIALLWSKVGQLKEERDSANAERERAIELSNITSSYNKQKIDSLANLSKTADSSISSYQLQLKQKQAEQVAITGKYKKIKNEIHNTPDSGQSAITRRLLTELSRYE